MKEDLINRIKTRREQLGLSCEDMAKKIGVSRYGYALLEKGTNVGINTVIKACEVLGLKISIK